MKNRIIKMLTWKKVWLQIGKNELSVNKDDKMESFLFIKKMKKEENKAKTKKYT